MYIVKGSKTTYILIWNVGHIAYPYLHAMKSLHVRLQSRTPSSPAHLVQDLGHMGPSPPVPNHIRQARFIPPILRVKLRGDVIFHLGSVIILVLSGALPWLGGRSEPSGSFPLLPLPIACLSFPAPHPPLPRPCAGSVPRPLTAMNESGRLALSTPSGDAARIDLWCFRRNPPGLKWQRLWRLRGQHSRTNPDRSGA